MNREQLDEIRKRVEKATPGPWYVVGPPWNSSTPWVNAGSPDPHQMSFVCDLDADLAGVEREDGAGNEPADAEFIAAARTDVPALLDEIDRLNQKIKSFEEFGSAEALRAGVDHRCPSRVSTRGAVIRCFYYRGHTEDRTVVVPLHEAAGTAWHDDDDRVLADLDASRSMSAPVYVAGIERPYACPRCGARYRTPEHAAGCADDHATEGAEGSAEGGNPKGSSEDPLVVAVLNAAIVWRQNLEPVEPPVDVDEYALITAVDAMLSARHNLRETGKETS